MQLQGPRGLRHWWGNLAITAWSRTKMNGIKVLFTPAKPGYLGAGKQLSSAYHY